MNEGQTFIPESVSCRFCRLPVGLLTYDGLSHGAKLCWARLARYAGKDGEAFPSLATLGRELAVSERTARTYVKELVDKGFIRTIRRGQGRSSKQVFLWRSVIGDEDRQHAADLDRQDLCVERRDSADLDRKDSADRRESDKKTIRESGKDAFEKSHSKGPARPATQSKTFQRHREQRPHQIDRLQQASREALDGID